MVRGVPWQSRMGADSWDRYDGTFNDPRFAIPTRQITIAGVLREHCSLPIKDFAMVATMDDGKTQTFTSDSLQDLADGTLSQRLQDVYTNMLRRGSMQYPLRGHRQDALSSEDTESGSGPRRASSGTDSSSAGRGRFRNMRLDDTDEDSSSSAMHTRKRHRAGLTASYTGPEEDDTPMPAAAIRTRQIAIGDEEKITEFLINRLKMCQQNACKIAAKAFVKAIEPKKQTNYPYTKAENSAPPWWPPLPKDDPVNGVRHREPDHLLKNERIALIMHILKVRFLSGDARRNITIAELQAKTNEAIQNWYSDRPENMAKKPYLDEFFKIAKQQERYRRNEIDGTCFVTVKHGDDRSHIDAFDNEPDDGVKFEDDEGQILTPQSQQMSSDGLVSPHTAHMTSLSHRTEQANNYTFGQIRDLPVPEFAHSLPPVGDNSYAESNPMTIGSTPNYLPRNDYPQSQPARSWPTQHNGFPSPTPSGMYNNWTPNNNIGSNSPLPFNSYNQIPTVAQSAPFLPPPNSAPSILPPMQQTHSDVNRGFDHYATINSGMRTGLGPHSNLQGQGYQEYLHDNPYQEDERMKDEHMHGN